MKRLIVIAAAALMASAPVVAAMTTDGYAAAKKATRVAKTPAAPVETGRANYRHWDDYAARWRSHGCWTCGPGDD